MRPPSAQAKATVRAMLSPIDSDPLQGMSLFGAVDHLYNNSIGQCTETRSILHPMARAFDDFNKAQVIERFGKGIAPRGVVKEHVM